MPDAFLLSLASRLEAARHKIGVLERATNYGDDRLTATCNEFNDACRAIIAAPVAISPQGKALKAAAAMLQLRAEFNSGFWGSMSVEAAWDYFGAQIPNELVQVG